MSGEPTVHLVDQATRVARAESCDLVIAQGGGSVIDAGKAVAVMLTNPGDVLEYLELVYGELGKDPAELLRRAQPLDVSRTAGQGEGTDE